MVISHLEFIQGGQVRGHPHRIVFVLRMLKYAAIAPGKDALCTVGSAKAAIATYPHTPEGGAECTKAAADWNARMGPRDVNAFWIPVYAEAPASGP
jgi:hypothetical protein